MKRRPTSSGGAPLGGQKPLQARKSALLRLLQSRLPYGARVNGDRSAELKALERDGLITISRERFGWGTARCSVAKALISPTPPKPATPGPYAKRKAALAEFKAERKKNQ